ncbi:MAG: sulfatase-like hydrolase/transferase [Proteobacteria bacterium]|nr:sulfatase-like hydrolase/transferase [Pseudomonadota bacterium]MCP4917474.1 sulfatase-like hydrolase/transferase [Pseudomonadota bacterium]
MDTVRRDRLSTYGYERHTSNQLTAVAEAGVLFRDTTVSGSWTWPGHAALFTGEPPWVSGARYNEAPARPPIGQMRTDLPTLAERFSEAGYRTASVATNHLLAEDLGLTRGFESIHAGGNDTSTIAKFRETAPSPDDRPTLMLLNLLSAHAPYEAVPGIPFADEHIATIRDAPEGSTLAAMRIDNEGSLSLDPGEQCGDFRCDLKWTGGAMELTPSELDAISDLYDANLVLLDSTMPDAIEIWTTHHPGGIVVVTSDHGELLGEHRMLQHRFAIWPELVEIPLAIVGPGFPAGTKTDVPVQVRDLYPTLLEEAGIAEFDWTLRDAMAGTPRPGPIQAAAWPDPANAQLEALSKPWALHREGDVGVIVTGDHVFQLTPAEAPASMVEAARALLVDPATTSLRSRRSGT